VLNRTPESFKTDVATQGGDAKSSLAETARRLAELLKSWSRSVRGIFSRASNESQIGLEPRPLDDPAFAKRGHRVHRLWLQSRSLVHRLSLSSLGRRERGRASPLSLASTALRRSVDLVSQHWQRLARAAAFNLSQLDRTLESLKVELERRDDRASLATAGRRRFAALLLRGWQLFARVTFSSLSRRIIFLNVTGLLALVIGILYLSQFRAGLIDARIQSLLVQGEIIASAVAASAAVESDTNTMDPERLLDLQAGESYGPSEEARRTGAAPPRLAHQHTRAHVRSRRRSHSRQPQSLRRAALRFAAAHAQTRRSRARLRHHPHLV
jgi:hypothetical protein